MKTEIHCPMTPAPQEERSILDEIRNDHELIARLQITPQELQALSKCALLGTLTSKDDMLFILRQIREATSASAVPALPPPELSECPSLSQYEDQPASLPAPPQSRGRIAPLIIPEIDAPGINVRRRLSWRLVVLSLTAMVAAVLLWEGFIAISRGGFLTTIGTQLSQAPASTSWYGRADRFSVLLTFEALFVVAIMTVVCLRSLRGFSRLKVKPGWRY